MEDLLVDGGSAIDPIGRVEVRRPGSRKAPGEFMADGGSIIDPIGWGEGVDLAS